MRKITLSLFFLSLAVLMAAQERNDRAWLDLNQTRTLWMASGNAAGLQLRKRIFSAEAPAAAAQRTR